MEEFVEAKIEDLENWISEHVKDGRDVYFAVRKLNSLKALVAEYHAKCGISEQVDFDVQEEDLSED